MMKMRALFEPRAKFGWNKEKARTESETAKEKAPMAAKRDELVAACTCRLSDLHSIEVKRTAYTGTAMQKTSERMFKS